MHGGLLPITCGSEKDLCLLPRYSHSREVSEMITTALAQCPWHPGSSVVESEKLAVLHPKS